ncbi:MAG: hypothetical protein WCP55_07260, partial [Lentisphaerota bacterium]
MESVIVLLALFFSGIVLIFPIWMIAVLYQIKNSQDKMNSEFREFMHIEREKRREAPKEFIKKMESDTAAAKPWMPPPPSQASEFESNA